MQFADAPAMSGHAPCAHPLDPLAATEIRAATGAVRAAHPELERPAFSLVVLEPPPKGTVRSFGAGDPIERRARIVVLDRASRRVFEARVRVDPPDGAIVERWVEVADAQPAMMRSDAEVATLVTKRDPRFVHALSRRGIVDLERVWLDVLTPGFFDDLSRDRRCLWAVPYLSHEPGDNHYARPIENVRALVDVLAEEVVAFADGPIVAMLGADGDYGEAAVGGYRPDLAPIEIRQPHGVGFEVRGNEVRWQGWRFHVSLDPVGGLVLSTVRHQDDDGERSILHRAALSEMVVPYGDPGEGFFWRSYFDAGEYGLGLSANSLTHGCDCLGAIHYFDAVLSDENGQPSEIPHAICVHEEDDGVLWKHTHSATGSAEVRRSRRLVVSSMSTIGNYDYGFFWSFYLDGSIELEIKLTGIVLTQGAPEDGATLRHASRIAPGLAAPHHQHLFNFRLDMEVDGPNNSLFEVDLVASPADDDNPHLGAMETVETPVLRESEGRRAVAAQHQRHWKITNPGRLNAQGEPVAYRLIPHEGPTLLAWPQSTVARRAAFACHHIWATCFDPGERHAAGDFPNQSPGGDGLPAWTGRDRSLVNTDIVLWHTLGVSHAVRPEDWPVMPVDRIGFALRPVGFFDRNPAIDLPPQACRA